ncbi:hypothetical protein ALC56_05209, partial [Trachymyrmex septentrionalis]
EDDTLTRLEEIVFLCRDSRRTLQRTLARDRVVARNNFIVFLRRYRHNWCAQTTKSLSLDFNEGRSVRRGQHTKSVGYSGHVVGTRSLPSSFTSLTSYTSQSPAFCSFASYLSR